MSDIKRVFEKDKAFIPFITVGDPDIGTSKEIIRALAEEGATLIELGIPFSDPMAEGPVIQNANIRGLKSGVTADDVFNMVKELRAEGVSVLFAIMTYANVVFSYGIDAFLSKMEDSGFSALILPDVPFEEKKEFSIPAEKHGISLISLVAPTSEERIKMIAGDASGFVYVVSSLGVTGMRTSFSSNIEEVVKAVKNANPDIPVAIGFGISNAQSAKKMAAISDGVIIGSAIVDIIGREGKNSPKYVRAFVREIIRAIREESFF